MAFSSAKVGHLVVFTTYDFIVSRMTTDFSVMSVYLSCLVWMLYSFTILVPLLVLILIWLFRR